MIEIDAERCGISDAGAFLSQHFGNDKAEELLLQYVNNKVDNWDYYIGRPKCGIGYTNIRDVFDAFDGAYESAKHSIRRYDKNWSQCIDEAFLFAKTKMSQSAHDRLFDEPDGAKQDAMMAAITLHCHPEYKGWHKSLQDMDLSMETMFGENWRRIDKPKPIRRLPDVPVDTYNPLRQYEP